MNKFILAILFSVLTNIGHSQSLEQDKIYATQFRNVIYLDNQLDISLSKLGNSTIHILETNENNQVTRELNRLSDSTFLYTEYLPIDCEAYISNYRNNRITKQGVIVFSNETVIDSSVIQNPELFEPYPSPRKRNIFKQTGEWFEIYKQFDKNYRVKGSYNSYGKHGEWLYYTNLRELDKKTTYENGTLIKEDFINILNYKSIEKTRKILQRTWALQFDSNRNPFLNTNILNDSRTYKFEQDGTFSENSKRKGIWSLLDYKTIDIIIGSRKRTLTLEHLSEKGVRYTRDY